MADVDLGGEESIGGKLRRLRQDKGWSLDAAAARWQTSASTVSRIERDLLMPEIPIAYRVERDLGLRMMEWLRSPLTVAA